MIDKVSFFLYFEFFYTKLVLGKLYQMFKVRRFSGIRSCTGIPFSIPLFQSSVVWNVVLTIHGFF